jgi:hypothetical protein
MSGRLLVDVLRRFHDSRLRVHRTKRLQTHGRPISHLDRVLECRAGVVSSSSVTTNCVWADRMPHWALDVLVANIVVDLVDLFGSFYRSLTRV